MSRNQISYCVKEKRQTECVPGSEVYKKARNGRNMMQCLCASCGSKKTSFIKGQEGGIVGDIVLGTLPILGKLGYETMKLAAKAGVKKGLKSEYVKKGAKKAVNQFTEKTIDDILDTMSSKINLAK